MSIKSQKHIAKVKYAMLYYKNNNNNEQIT